MPTNKQTNVQLTGLVKQPNPYGAVPPGALSVGHNIQIKRQSVIEPRVMLSGRTELPPELSGYRRMRNWAAENGVFSAVGGLGAEYADHLTWDTLTAFEIPELHEVKMNPTRIGSDVISFREGRAGMVRVRNRYIFTDNTNPIVVDNETVERARSAGLPAPNLALPFWAPGVLGTVLQPGYWCSYRATFYKIVSSESVITGVGESSYRVEGAVTTSAMLFNGTDPAYVVNPVVQVSWNKGEVPLVAGDRIRLYRTKQQLEKDLLGDRFMLAVEHILTQDEIDAGIVWELEDNCLDTGLSADLYYNFAQQGAGKDNYMPPPSSAIAVFKSVVFYAAYQSWQSIEVKAPSYWGPSIADGDGHYGMQGIIGDLTAGSPVITNVVTSMEYLEVGQQIGTSHLPGPPGPTIPTIIALDEVARTITMDRPSGATMLASTWFAVDMIAINGVSIPAPHLAEFLIGTRETVISGVTPITVQTSKAFVNYTGATYTGDYITNGITLNFINQISGGAPFTLAATNGELWSPPLPSLAETPQTSNADPRTNRLYFSKVDQPENVPPGNFILVGHGAILGLQPMQEQLIVLCTDGTYSVTGVGDKWDVRPFNDTKLLVTDAFDCSENTIYAWTEDGLCRISEQGNVERLSSPYIHDEIVDLQRQFIDDKNDKFFWGVQVIIDRLQNEVWFNWDKLTDVSSHWAACYIWNVNTTTWVNQSEIKPNSMVYFPRILRPVLFQGAWSYTYDYGYNNWMPVRLRENPIASSDLGEWKQWLDVTMHFEDLGEDIMFWPEWDGIEGLPYIIPATAGSFEHVVVPPQTVVYNKDSIFGFRTTPAYFRLMGLSYRFRVASETLRQ